MKLNPAQIQAVHARAQDMLVLACAGADPAEWPEDLRVQEFPEVAK